MFYHLHRIFGLRRTEKFKLIVYSDQEHQSEVIYLSSGHSDE